VKVFDWIKSKLVAEWTKCYKWLSVQFAAVVAIAPILYEQLGIMREYVPQAGFSYFMAAMGILVIIGRLKAQK